MDADFDRLEGLRGLVDRAVERFGRLDILVNNAGITMNQPLLKVTPAQFDRLYHVNVRAGYLLMQYAVEAMLAGGKGRAICNLTSVHGLQRAPEFSAYAGTKGAIIAHTRTLGMELAHLGIRVNAIAPGWITVENHRKAMPALTKEKLEEMAYKQIPVARVGLPEDVARLAVHLCSDHAGNIVGQTFVIDVGSTSLMSLLADFRAPIEGLLGTGYVPGR